MELFMDPSQVKRKQVIIKNFIKHPIFINLILNYVIGEYWNWIFRRVNVLVIVGTG